MQPFVCCARHTLMRAMRTVWAGLLGLVLGVAVGGCGSGVTRQSNGAWAGCGDVTRPTSVTVQRLQDLNHKFPPLVVTQSDPQRTRKLYYDFCLIEGHPAGDVGTVDCPADVGLSYLGTFLVDGRRLADFHYWATGCQWILMTVGKQTAKTMIFGKAAAAEPASFEHDLTAVLGIPSGQPR